MRNLARNFLIFISVLSILGLAMAELPVGPWDKLLETTDTAGKIAGFLNESFGVSAGIDGEIKYTNDGGKHWLSGENESLVLVGLELLDAGNIWCCGDAAQVRGSHDNGKTWQKLANYGPNYATSAQTLLNSYIKPVCGKYLSFIDAQTGWIATPRQLAATFDGAKTWQDLKLPEGLVEVGGICLRTPTEGYIFEEVGPGKLFITKDGGKSWTTRPLALPGEHVADMMAPMGAIRFTDAQTGMIVCSRKGGAVIALRTTDGGKSWSQETVPGRFGAVFLARDGKTLTITGIFGDIMVLRRR